eukprot:Sspe_Gene.91578::Locus_63091_Transcript_1_1_Confidence_1.000_Length_461::g.91578::m.91578
MVLLSSHHPASFQLKCHLEDALQLLCDDTLRALRVVCVDVPVSRWEQSIGSRVPPNALESWTFRFDTTAPAPTEEELCSFLTKLQAKLAELEPLAGAQSVVMQ